MLLMHKEIKIVTHRAINIKSAKFIYVNKKMFALMLRAPKLTC